MDEREIRQDEKQCISHCIHRFWNVPDDVKIKDRDRKYEECLTECRVCS